MDAIVVMGPTGCGKTTLGRALADALDWHYVDGDALHPPANVVKMAAGQPLDDQDRAPFLDNVARVIRSAPAGIVVSCSALKRAYRDNLRASADRSVCFVLPEVSRAALLARVQARDDHFMPASLVDSQLADFEPLHADERAVRVPGAIPTNDQVARVLAALGK